MLKINAENPSLTVAQKAGIAKIASNGVVDLQRNRTIAPFLSTELILSLLKQDKPIYQKFLCGSIVDEKKTYKKVYNLLNEIIEATGINKLLLQSEGGYERNIFLTNEKTDKILSFNYCTGQRAYVSIILLALNKDLEEVVEEITNKHFVKEKQATRTVFAISQDRQGLSLKSLGKLNDKLSDIVDNYDDEVIRKSKYVIQEYNKETPAGRLVILNGPPGTGKTHLVRGILPELNKGAVILLPTRLVGSVDGPELVTLLADWKEEFIDSQPEEKGNETMPIIFVLEDADECLVKRSDGNPSTVSSLLNYTDGIFGSLMDIRVIATTNAEHIEFDDAYKRPGRLCAHIKVKELEKHQANRVYKRLTKNNKSPYTNKTTLASIYADALGYEVDQEKEVNKVGFGT